MRLGLSLGISSVTGTVVEADSTAPVVNSDSYTSATQTLALDITEASGSATLFGATVANPNTPSKSDIENNTGTALDTFTQAITEGGGPYTISGLTDETADEIHYFLRDAAGNETAIRILTGVVVDDTAPALSSAILAADGVTLTLTYAETLAGTADAADYTVEADAVGVTVSTATRTGSTVVLDLAAAINASPVVVTVSYTGTAIEDTFGNAAATLTDQAVTNNSTQGATYTQAEIDNNAVSYFKNTGGIGTTSETQFTISFWATFVDTGTTQAVTKFSFNRGPKVRVNQFNNFAVELRDGAGANLGSFGENGVITFGTKHHFCVTADYATPELRLYVDGVRVAVTASNAFTGGNGFLRLDGDMSVFADAESTPTEICDITFSDFMAFNSIVSVASLYNGGTPPDPSGFSPLVLFGGDGYTVANANAGVNNGSLADFTATGTFI